MKYHHLLFIEFHIVTYDENYANGSNIGPLMSEWVPGLGS
jgi:hypothetical protein